MLTVHYQGVRPGSSLGDRALRDVVGGAGQPGLTVPRAYINVPVP